VFDSITPFLTNLLRFLAVVVDYAAPGSDDGEENGPVSRGEFAGEVWEPYALLSDKYPL
jgi:hypothetical protein